MASSVAPVRRNLVIISHRDSHLKLRPTILASFLHRRILGFARITGRISSLHDIVVIIYHMAIMMVFSNQSPGEFVLWTK